MKLGTLPFLIAILVPIHIQASDVWGPDLIKFDLEGGSKDQIMHWISGYSYSTTEFLRSVNCLSENEYIGSEELIVAVNQISAGKTVTSEQASVIINNHVQKSYHCAAYNK